MPRLATLCLLAATLSCGKKETPVFHDAAPAEVSLSPGPGVRSGAAKGDAATGDAAARDAAAADAAFTLPPSEPGAIFLVARDSVASVLPDGTVRTVAGTRGEVHGLALGADGHAYASISTDLGPARRDNILRLDGATSTKVAAIKGAFLATIAIDKDGVIYGAQTDDVYRYAEGTLTTLPKPSVFVNELAFDAQNQLVAAGTGAAFVLTNGTWAPIAIPDLQSTDAIWLVGHGADLRLAVSDHGFFALENGKVRRVLAERVTRGDRPYRTTNGILAFTVYEDSVEKVRLVAPDGSSTVADARPGALSNLVVDGRGRLWSLADGALVVTELLGSARTEYAIGTLGPLVGAHRNDEHGMVALGGGPTTLPAQGAAQVVERVTATIMIDKKPLARSEVEICTFAAMSYHTSPCEDAKSRKVATTNERGQVTFENVPLGMYRVAFKHGDTWGFAMGDSITLDKPARARTLGRLDYTTR